MGLNAEPTAAEPTLISATVSASKPSRRDEHEQRRDDRDDLLLHVLERAPGGEGETDDRDRDDPAIAEPAHEPVDAIAEGARLVDDAERAAHQKHERDDGRRIDDSVGMATTVSNGVSGCAGTR